MSLRFTVNYPIEKDDYSLKEYLVEMAPWHNYFSRKNNEFGELIQNFMLIFMQNRKF